MEHGATRNFQAEKLLEEEEKRVQKEREDEELNNPMKASPGPQHPSPLPCLYPLPPLCPSPTPAPLPGVPHAPLLYLHPLPIPTPSPLAYTPFFAPPPPPLRPLTSACTPRS